MEINIITVYAYHGDGGEFGQGPVMGWCSTESAAKVAGKHSGYFNSQGYVTKSRAMQVGQSVYLLVSDTPIDLDGLSRKHDDKIRSDVLARTSEQKRVLGL